jgi:hypothetical protein
MRSAIRIVRRGTDLVCSAKAYCANGYVRRRPLAGIEGSIDGPPKGEGGPLME